MMPLGYSREGGRAYSRVISVPAGRYDLSPSDVVGILSYTLETIAEEVAAGEIVPLPGFGVFGAWIPRTRGSRPPPDPMPAFSPSRGFRNDLLNLDRWRAQVTHDYIQRHRRNHHPGSGSTSESASVHSAQPEVRRQAGKSYPYSGLEDRQISSPGSYGIIYP